MMTMKLKKITIQGFKSFAQLTELPIADGITAIVGPNGSGKSNVLDAIKWLFGEHSLKNLRADEKYDLIFAGSEDVPPAKRAYVELVFEKDGKLFSVARELMKSGKNVFYVDGKPSRLKDIKSLFAGTGVGKDFYSVIAQGQVERLTSSSSKELRALFEEAAGTAYYREKKREALIRLNNVESNLTAVNNVLYEKEKLMKSLYLKAKRAEKYLEYTEKLKEVKRLYFGNKLLREEKRKEEIESELEEKRKKLRSLRKEMMEVESRWNDLREQVEEMDKKLSSFTRLLQDYEKRKSQLVDLSNLYRRQLSELENDQTKALTTIESLSEEKKRLEGRKEEILVLKKSVNEQLNALNEEIQKILSEKMKRESELSEKQKEALRLKEKITKIEKTLKKLELDYEKLLASEEDFKEKIKLINEQWSDKEERLNDVKNEIEEMRGSLETGTDEEKKLETELNAIRERKVEVENEKEGIIREIHDLLKKKSEIQGEINSLQRLMNEYTGFSRAVRAVFSNKDKFKGLYDVVANIVKVDEEYEKAVSALLGGAVQNIVVKDADVAKEIIEFLKVNDFGRATFLPLDLIDGSFSVHDTEIEMHPGFVGFAVDLVEVPKGFEKLPVYLFGSDVVVRTLEDAIDIKRRFKIRSRIATLDGELISGRGAITGGSQKITDSVIGRKTRLEALKVELKELDIRLKELEKLLKEVDRKLENYRKMETEVQMKLSEIISKNATTKRILNELIKTAKSLEKELSNLKSLKVNYENRLSGIIAKKDRLRQQIEEEKIEFLKMEKILENFGGELEEKRRDFEKLTEKLVDLKMKKSELERAAEGYAGELESLNERLKAIDEKINLERELIRRRKAEIEKVKAELEKNEEELKTVTAELEELFGNVNIHHEDKTKIFQEIKNLESELTAMREKRENIIEDIHRLENHLQEINMNILRYREEVPDYEDVPFISDMELYSLEQQLNDLLRKVKGIGSVDLDAIEEYKNVEEEYKQIVEQKEDLENAKKKLLDIIKKTEEKARSRFLNIHRQVNENFSKYIKELFFGGEGRISMSDDKDVFESELIIEVKKPGRRLQKLQLLSGGEKALVAIALLFSFLQVNPSPFYVLDEVDGPLDDYNAERFARFLKELSKDAQFLIITHNKIVMESADLLHGITMSKGVSVVIPVEMLKTG